MKPMNDRENTPMKPEARALLDHIDRAEAIDGIRRGLKSFEEGKGKPAMRALRELKRRQGIQS
jgi:hypothetical protein